MPGKVYLQWYFTIGRYVPDTPVMFLGLNSSKGSNSSQFRKCTQILDFVHFPVFQSPTCQ